MLGRAAGARPEFVAAAAAAAGGRGSSARRARWTGAGRT